MSIRQLSNADGRPRLLITGASTRAAAWSAIRAGFFPVCADRFADEDLLQVAEVCHENRIEDCLHSDSHDITTVARISVTDWVSDFSILKPIHPTFGPFLGPSFLVSKKGILQLGAILGEHSISALKEKPGLLEQLSMAGEMVREYLYGVPSGGHWLEKPVRSGGGRGIRLWNQTERQEHFRELSYFQEYRSGQPMSAIFLANRNRSPMVELIGLTEQLIGEENAAAPSRFAYCGNIAPATLPAEATHTLQRIGEVLADKLEQRGIFGVDFIWDGNTPWVVEVNPRYTASCELLELALGRALLRDHWQAWLPNEPLPALPEEPRTRPGVIGKLILYARTAVTAPDLSRFLKPRSPWTVPFLADIPRQGTAFSPGDPMCTVFATAATPDVCRKKLHRRAERVRRWFGDLVAPGGVIS